MGCSPYRFAAPVASLPRRSLGCLQWHACNHGKVLLKISMSNGDSSCAQKVIDPPHFQNGEHHTTFTPDTFYTKRLLHQIQSFVLRHDASLGHWYAGVDTRSSSQAPYFWAKKPRGTGRLWNLGNLIGVVLGCVHRPYFMSLD